MFEIEQKFKFKFNKFKFFVRGIGVLRIGLQQYFSNQSANCTLQEPNMRRCLLASLSIATTTAAFAHPGHGSAESAAGESLWHFFSEPIHSVPFIAVAVLAIAAYKIAAKRIQPAADNASAIK